MGMRALQDVSIDPATEADAAAVLELLVTVFDDTPPEWYEAAKTDPPYPESVRFVARADGRIVSHAEVLVMPVRYGEATLLMGAISGVATLPEWRGRGLATSVMERLIVAMTERQMPLSLLMTGSVPFYERLGWSAWTPPGRSMSWEDARAMVDPRAVRRGMAPIAVAPYAPADLGEMMDLYDRTSAARPVTLLRPERYWRSLMLRWLEAMEYPGQRNAVYVARREGRLVAYCFAYTDEDALTLSEVAYDEAEAVLPLLRAAVEGVGPPAPGRLTAILPWESEALRLMESTGRSVSHKPIGLMWRINDLPGLLRQVRPELERRLAALPVAPGGAKELRLACGLNEAVLAVSHGRVTIGGSAGAAVSPEALCCRLSQEDLVTLFLGTYPSPQWLEERGLPEEARPWLAGLFPPGRGIYWLTDNF